MSKAFGALPVSRTLSFEPEVTRAADMKQRWSVSQTACVVDLEVPYVVLVGKAVLRPWLLLDVALVLHLVLVPCSFLDTLDEASQDPFGL